MLTQAGCLSRQERFRALLSRLRLDAAIISDANEIYYLTGFLIPDWLAHPAALYLETEGESILVCQTNDATAFVDHCLTYEPHLLFTRNLDLVQRLRTSSSFTAFASRSPPGDRLSTRGFSSDGALGKGVSSSPMAT